jgi:hypothetical protein
MVEGKWMIDVCMIDKAFDIAFSVNLLLLELSLLKEDLLIWIIGDHSFLRLSPKESGVNV